MSEKSSLSVPSTGVPTGSPESPPRGSPLANPSVPSADTGTGDGLESGRDENGTAGGAHPRSPDRDEEEEKHS
jgi:hypothetical protein